MAQFTVIAAQKKADKPDKGYGPMQLIGLTLKDHMDQTQIAEWFTSASTPLPAEGSTIDGVLEHDPKFGLKFKKPKAGGAAGGFRPRDPKETAAIQRQHSQSAAVAYLQAKATAGGLGSATFPGTEDLRALIDWFQRDIEFGVALAQQQGSYGTATRRETTVVTGASDVPSDGPPVPSPVADDDMPWGDAAA
jgi:hypothetical protein